MQHLINVELNDGTLPGSPHNNSSNRRLCVEGEYDLRGFIDCVQKMVYTGSWAVEAVSEKLARLPLKEFNISPFNTSLEAFEGP